MESMRAPTTVRKRNKTRASFRYFSLYLPRTCGMIFRSFFHSFSHSGTRFWNDFLNVWLLLLNTDFDENFNNFGSCACANLFFLQHTLKY